MCFLYSKIIAYFFKFALYDHITGISYIYIYAMFVFQIKYIGVKKKCISGIYTFYYFFNDFFKERLRMIIYTKFRFDKMKTLRNYSNGKFLIIMLKV